MDNKKKKMYIISIAIAAILIAATVGVSYAFFTARVTENNKYNTTITTGNIMLAFDDGLDVSPSEKFVPGDYIDKIFEVTNLGDNPATFDIYFRDIVNTFVDKTDLVYTISYTDSNNQQQQTTQVQLPSTPTAKVLTDTLGVGESREYTLHIQFLETQDNQDDNKGATFSVTIGINDDSSLVTVASNEVHYAPPAGITTSCTGDDETLECALDELTEIFN